MRSERALLLASGNRHKHEEFSAFFRTLPAFRESGYRLLSTADFPGGPDVEETGATYEENAHIKACVWAAYAGMPTIADDSGIEVRALDWEPGIRSARAAPGGDADRVRWLLERMHGVADRRACFVACIVVAPPSCGQEAGGCFAAEGRCWGSLAPAPSGGHGFGYDPVFVPDGYGGTFGELDPQVKSRISHRAIAMRGMAHMVPSVIKYQSMSGLMGDM